MIKRLRTSLLLVLLALLVSQCYVLIRTKDRLTLINEEFQLDSVSFRIDGIYYQVNIHPKNTKLVDSIMEPEDGVIFKVANKEVAVSLTPMIFYENGFVYYSFMSWGLAPFSTEKEKDSIIHNTISYVEDRISELANRYDADRRISIGDWGLYKQYGDSLFIQTYRNVMGDYSLMDITGRVENDSTITIISRQYHYPLDGGKQINATSFFKSFSPKPDSTNYISTHPHKFGNRKRQKPK